ncbi:ABC transporter substrate-binding protein [Brevibacillus invocatus]|uniref:ABC transporter substrate-binding protein n=1 Tax=Brevibacillus invocatus TaxID=173959 RepID=A0A3M8BXD5_9BACL|nr:ABC transporter substrate-binding protein [Brevibacillus invocatus]RNB68014.1 ABC transporter substrate-binding protein [Brevibacillus invocatus]
MRKGNNLSKLLAGILITSLTTITIGCGASNGDNPQQSGTTTITPGEPQKGGTVTIAVDGEPDTLDTHKTHTGIASSLIADFFGASLLYLDPETKTLQPSLAESYTISDDRKAWTFKLRKDVTFSDGTPLTAKIYSDTFNRMLEPEHLAATAASFYDGLSRAEAPDDETLILHFDRPSAPILTYLSMPAYAQPMPVDLIKKTGDEYGRKPVGVGPWQVTEWKTGESIALVRNDGFNLGAAYYKNQKAPYLDGLIFRFIKDAQTVKAALESGSVDIAYNLNGKVAKSFRDNPKYQVLEELNNGEVFLGMNLQDKRFQDPAVRRAISYAINKEAIVQAALQGEGVAAHSPLANSIFGFDPASADYDYKYNVEQAKKELENAGWTLNGEGVREKDGQQLRVSLIIRETRALEGQLIQSMLAEIGIKVKNQQLEGGAYYDAANKKTFDLIIGQYGDVDPDILYYLFHSTQSGNKYSINDAQLDDLLVKARSTFEQDKRVATYKDVQKLIIDQAYVVPLYVQINFIVINSKVKDVKYGNNALMLNDAWISK